MTKTRKYIQEDIKMWNRKHDIGYNAFKTQYKDKDLKDHTNAQCWKLLPENSKCNTC